MGLWLRLLTRECDDASRLTLCHYFNNLVLELMRIYVVAYLSYYIIQKRVKSIQNNT